MMRAHHSKAQAGEGICLQRCAIAALHLATAPGAFPGAQLSEALWGPDHPQMLLGTIAWPSQMCPPLLSVWESAVISKRS